MDIQMDVAPLSVGVVDLYRSSIYSEVRSALVLLHHQRPFTPGGWVDEELHEATQSSDEFFKIFTRTYLRCQVAGTLDILCS